jgi:hypothetical protein
MMAGVSPEGHARRTSVIGLAGALFGIVLFAWFVREVGPDLIWNGVRDVGWGLAVIVALTGLRFAVRAVTWRLCLEPPHRLPFREAFAAIVAGDAVGNLTPLGVIASEPAKVALVGRRVPFGPALTALAIENMFYALSVAAVIAAATLALLFTVELPGPVRRASQLAIAAIVLIFVAAAWTLWRRPLVISHALAMILPRTWAARVKLDRVRALEEQIFSFAARRRGVLAPVIAGEVAFHALGMLEVYVTWLFMLGTPPPLLIAFILEGANRLITVVFKFIPLRIGVDEYGTGTLTQILGYGAAPGATLAIVRKARVVFWVMIGTALLVRIGLTRTADPRPTDGH